jgi:hypothetical protein
MPRFSIQCSSMVKLFSLTVNSLMRFINNRKKLFIKRTDILLQHRYDINIADALVNCYKGSYIGPYWDPKTITFRKLGHVLAPIKSDIDLESSQT